jgi:hypothetical protein
VRQSPGCDESAVKGESYEQAISGGDIHSVPVDEDLPWNFL